MEVQEEDPRENVDEPDAPLSPNRSQASAHSVRRTPSVPKGPQSVSSRTPKEPSALMQDPFATITNTKKCKAHQETFEAIIGRPRGDNPNHVILGDAGMDLAKRVPYPLEAERWPSVEANAFTEKYLTLIQ